MNTQIYTIKNKIIPFINIFGEVSKKCLAPGKYLVCPTCLPSPPTAAKNDENMREKLTKFTRQFESINVRKQDIINYSIWTWLISKIIRTLKSRVGLGK